MTQQVIDPKTMTLINKLRFYILPNFECEAKDITVDDNKIVQITYKCKCGYEEEIQIIDLVDRIREDMKICGCCIIDPYQYYSFLKIYNICRDKGCTMTNTNPLEYNRLAKTFKYICGKCENVHESTYKSFSKYGTECAYNNLYNLTKQKRYNKIIRIFKKKKCILLTNIENFNNSNDLFQYFCISCEKNNETLLVNFRNGCNCNDTRNWRAEKYNKINQIVVNNNCILLTPLNDYINNKTKIQYKCNKCESINYGLVWDIKRHECIKKS